MTKVQDKSIKNIWSQNFKKVISVARKKNDEDFFYKVRLPSFFFFSYTFLFLFYLLNFFLHSHVLQIDYHFSTFLVTNIIIKKHQKMATIHVDASLKAKWLQWWNSSTKVKIENKFPSALPFCE